MKILAISDEECKALWDYMTPDKIAGVELVIACGERSRATYEGAVEAGAQARHFADKAELIANLKDVIRSGDVVLVKASHCMAFEDIVAALEKL